MKSHPTSDGIDALPDLDRSNQCDRLPKKLLPVQMLSFLPGLLLRSTLSRSSNDATSGHHDLGRNTPDDQADVKQRRGLKQGDHLNSLPYPTILNRHTSGDKDARSDFDKSNRYGPVRELSL